LPKAFKESKKWNEMLIEMPIIKEAIEEAIEQVIEEIIKWLEEVERLPVVYADKEDHELGLAIIEGEEEVPEEAYEYACELLDRIMKPGKKILIIDGPTPTWKIVVAEV